MLSLDGLSKVDPGTIISSKYRRHSSNCNPRRTSSLNLKKVEGGFVRPKGITVNWYKPRLVASVFSISPGAMTVCQNPEFTLR